MSVPLEGTGHGAGYSVNDLGCGYGALFEFFAEQVPGAVSHYHGYDICPDMIAVAQARISDPHARFSLSDAASVRCDSPGSIIPPAKSSSISAMQNFRPMSNGYTRLARAITRCWCAARVERGFVFAHGCSRQR